MEIISHRGYWKSINEKNKEIAFRRSFELGYGTETDIRDCNGELVISHDMPSGNELSFRRFLEIYKEYPSSPTLALNVKADGLQSLAKSVLEEFNIQNYFFFDMSVPDFFGYRRCGLNVFCRSSEYEDVKSLISQAQGVWYDGFISLDFNGERAKEVFRLNSTVCIVSPELHGRNYKKDWELFKSSLMHNSNCKFVLCTDLPETATEFFYEK